MKNNYQIFPKLFLIMLLMISSSCKSDDDSNDNNPPEQEEGLLGDYRGTWNSTTSSGAVFTDFLISVRMTSETMNGDETILSGEFFASASFASCCGGENDGTITVRILDDQIISFTFNDQIIGCAGSFEGSGIINESGAFIIDFTGSDCDGDHVGVIILRK